RDLGLLWRERGAKADMRAELVGVIGEPGALQPDMHRRRHRAPRAGLAGIPHPALRVVELSFVELLVARHLPSPGRVGCDEIMMSAEKPAKLLKRPGPAGGAHASRWLPGRPSRSAAPWPRHRGGR